MEEWGIENVQVRNTTGSDEIIGGLGPVSASSTKSFTNYAEIAADYDVLTYINNGTIVFRVNDVNLSQADSLTVYEYGQFAMKLADDNPSTFSVSSLSLTAPATSYYAVIAEEAGNLAIGYNFSFGNGETGQDTGWTAYVPSGYSAVVEAMTLTTRNSVTAAQVNIVVNEVEQGGANGVSLTSSKSNTQVFATPLSISNGDILTFYCASVNGSTDGVVVSAIIRYTAT